MSPITVCLFLLCLALGSRAQGTSERGLPHASPCPAVYSYGWEPSGGWHGVITIIPPARFSEVQLVLRMTVPYYRPEAGVGRVEVKGGTPEIQAISRRAYRGERHKVQFMIIFPPFDDVPRVKEIFFNGKSFCVAGQVYADTRSTIELKYTLRTGLNVPLANGNDFSVVSTAPSKPDLVTVAILQPMDEARPMVLSPQSPSRPLPPGAQGPPRPGAQVTGPKPPCKCNKTQDNEEDNDFPTQHRPDNHVFHAFKPPSPSVEGGDEDPQDDDDVTRPQPVSSSGNYAPPPPASVNRPPPVTSSGSGNVGGNNYTPPPPARPGSSSGSGNVGGNNFAPPPPARPVRPSGSGSVGGNNYAPPPPARPGSSSGSGNVGGNNFAPPPPARPVRPSGSGNVGGNNFAPPPPSRPVRPSGSGNIGGNNYAPPPPSRPSVSNKNEEVDDKIYFIMTDRDEVNSPRIVKLLEHLLVISKKHYLVDLERLQLEKKRLSLEKYPHYTFVI